MIDWSRYLNFNRAEFDSPDLPGSGNNMNPEVLDRLQTARTAAGIAFIVNSGYRTIERNRRVGGVANSPHLGGHAVDIHCDSDANRWVIVTALLDAGFRRIGIAKTFIHADCDPAKNAERVWVY